MCNRSQHRASNVENDQIQTPHNCTHLEATKSRDNRIFIVKKLSRKNPNFKVCKSINLSFSKQQSCQQKVNVNSLTHI